MPALPVHTHLPLSPSHPPPHEFASAAPAATPPPTRRDPIPERMVQSVMTLTILELEEHLIPAQGAEDILYVYAGDIVVTHDIRRTLEVFDGDAAEAVASICTFVLEGIIGYPPPSR